MQDKRHRGKTATSGFWKIVYLINYSNEYKIIVAILFQCPQDESIMNPFVKIFSGVLLAMACALNAAAQSALNPPGQSAPRKLTQPAETLVVVGEAQPVPLAESTASVAVLPVAAETLRTQSFEDLLRQDASLQLQQRGAGGGQADIVLRGSTYEQTLVLVNGLRVDDAQTAHHNLDLPMPLESFDSIQILHGAGSTLHGVDALGGVVDFLTAAPQRDELRLRAGAGNFGINEQSLLGSLLEKQQSLRLTAARDFSSGFMADRDYRNLTTALEDWIGTRLGVTDLLVATSDRAFGANQFYGDYSSWERTKGWFAAARQELGPRTVASFGYRRHSDEFVLLRAAPSVYENNHIDSSWQASVRRTLPVRKTSLLLVGLEADGDKINSSNLGQHARNRGAGYADLDLRPANAPWNLSIGGREELFSGGDAVFSPHLAGSLRLPHAVKLRASGGYGFRLPTYTDLYYSDPATKGNPHLKPESAWSGEGGADWAANAQLSLSATGFYSRQHNTFDYVQPVNAPSSQPWQAVNLNGLRMAGLETSLRWQPSHRQKIEAGWTQLFGVQAPLNGLISRYALDYPVSNLHGKWDLDLGRSVHMSHSVTVTKPYQQNGVAAWNATPYPVWNASVSRDAGRLRPYLRLTNLSNTGYQEIQGVAMPGRSLAGGVSIWLSR
jgi:iron complex outermembrane receptor protein